MPLYQFTPVFFSFLSRGEHSTVIQAVRRIHVSLQLSCRARYLPPNSCLALCAFTFFTCWKASKISFFQQVGEKVDAFWWNFQVASSIPCLENRDRRFMSKPPHVSHLSGSADPLTPLTNLIFIIKCHSWQIQCRIFNFMGDLQYPVSLLTNDKLHCRISFSLN